MKSKRRLRDRERAILCLLLHSQLAPTAAAGPRTKPGVKNSTCVSHVGPRAGIIICYLARHENRKLHQKQTSWDSNVRSDMRCEEPGWLIGS